jgi:hypothetical protein
MLSSMSAVSAGEGVAAAAEEEKDGGEAEVEEAERRWCCNK